MLSEKIKVLWIGDAIVQSGFSVVTHNICNELCTKCDLEVFGVRYDGRAKNPYPYHVYPAQTSGDIYSFDFAAEVAKKEKPDVIVVFNDDNIVADYIFKLVGNRTPVVPLFPVNLLPVHKARLLSFSGADLNIKHIMTYTQFSKKELLNVNPNVDVTAIYHGVHNGVFFPLIDAKKYLGLEDKFVVGQVNTNTYRKRLDLFLEGFAKFADGKPDVVCLIHATNNDTAYELSNIAIDLHIENKTIFSAESVEFSQMNLLYNVFDVNCNTSIGEGFGLSLIEGAACGVPVLCPRHGNLVDIWTKGAEFIEIDRQEYVAGTRFVGDIISVDSLVDKLNKLYYDKLYLESLGKEAFDHSKSTKFSWKTVADKVYNVLLKAYKEKIYYIST
jgi:glycosyltransferase involved in cell wall biosynthesis